MFGNKDDEPRKGPYCVYRMARHGLEYWIGYEWSTDAQKAEEWWHKGLAESKKQEVGGSGVCITMKKRRQGFISYLV